jgi:hypothetical protein
MLECVEKNYDHGTIGEGFIETHHLKPIASLEKGGAVTYDFAMEYALTRLRPSHNAIVLPSRRIAAADSELVT